VPLDSRFGPSKYDRPLRWAWYWAPAVAWLVTVAVFSSQSFGARNTGGLLATILEFVHVKLSSPDFLILHYVIRKAAHFTAYGVLSALFFRALRASDMHRQIWKARYALIALVVCLVTSSADEIHQSYTPGRTGNWHDVALDMIGAIFVQLFTLFFLHTRWGQARWWAARRGTASNKSAAATVAKLAER
jgi:VanZ family protein